MLNMHTVIRRKSYMAEMVYSVYPSNDVLYRLVFHIKILCITIINVARGAATGMIWENNLSTKSSQTNKKAGFPRIHIKNIDITLVCLNILYAQCTC